MHFTRFKSIKSPDNKQIPTINAESSNSTKTIKINPKKALTLKTHPPQFKLYNI